jgi:creatinine amidohydrolase
VRFYDQNWMQLEQYLEREDRVVVPLGSVEQHAYLSVGTDAILAERAAVEAAEPLGVAVLPAIPFGLTPNFTSYAGTISLPMRVYTQLLESVLESLTNQGFRRILFLNGHAGNSPADNLAKEWRARFPDVQVAYHGWLMEPRIMALASAIEPEAGHASWLENFPWVRVEGASMPTDRKPMVDAAQMRVAGPTQVKRLLGDGNAGGPYAVEEERIAELWEAAVADIRATLEHGWRKAPAPK